MNVTLLFEWFVLKCIVLGLCCIKIIYDNLDFSLYVGWILFNGIWIIRMYYGIKKDEDED